MAEVMQINQQTEQKIDALYYEEKVALLNQLEELEQAKVKENC